MHRYHKLGKVAKKRHTVFRDKDGNIYHEELKGNKGFVGPSSLLYHIYPPTEVVSTKDLGAFEIEEDDDKTLRMRHFHTNREKKGGSAIMDRIPFLFNDDVIMMMCYPDKNDDYHYRNAQGDEIIYVSQGSGILETAFGNMKYSPGDYLVIPRGILHRYVMNDEAHTFLIVESPSEVRTPRRYRNEYGQIIERSPYSERDFRGPDKLVTHDEKGEFKIVVKQRNRFTEVTLGHHPCDVVGWDGFYYPYAFSIHDFEPITGRVHQPPPVHQTFETARFVICSFCPRMYDYHPESIPAPYNHSNIDSDEVLYYVDGDFMSRNHVEEGYISLHPAGIPHGPHPGAAEKSIGQTKTDELAVMIDTFAPLKLTKAAIELSDGKYHKSWLD